MWLELATIRSLVYMYAIIKNSGPVGHDDVFLYGLYETLEDAQSELLNLYNTLFKGERMEAPNWGVAVAQTRDNVYGAHKSYADGTREFDYNTLLSYRIETKRGVEMLEEDYKKKLI